MTVMICLQKMFTSFAEKSLNLFNTFNTTVQPIALICN